MLSLLRFILIFSLAFTLLFTVSLKPYLHPTILHLDQDSQLVTSANPLPDFQSPLKLSLTLPTDTHIFLITPKVHTTAVRPVSSLYHQDILTHDAYCPLKTLPPSFCLSKLLRTSSILPSLWHIQWVPLSHIPLWLPPYLSLAFPEQTHCTLFSLIPSPQLLFAQLTPIWLLSSPPQDSQDHQQLLHVIKSKGCFLLISLDNLEALVTILSLKISQSLAFME